jgi:hypothetical protein
MARMHQSRRHLLKSAAVVSAAIPLAKISIMPSFAAEGRKKDALTGIDQVLRQAADAKEVPGVVGGAGTSDWVGYVGAIWRQRAMACCMRAHLASATS